MKLLALSILLAATTATADPVHPAPALGGEVFVGSTFGLEAWAGWRVQSRVAVLAYGHVGIDDIDGAHLQLGAAVRVWPWTSPRPYLEAHAGVAKLDIGQYDCDPFDTVCHDDGPLIGAAGSITGGVELLHTRPVAIDARLNVGYEYYPADTYWNSVIGTVGLAVTVY